MTTTAFELDAEAAIRLARRALVNLAREYPNHPQYLLESDADLLPPRRIGLLVSLASRHLPTPRYS